MGTEQVYRYAAASRLAAGRAGVPELLLATSGGTTDRGPGDCPHFFSGLLTRPEQSAVALLAVARVARSRYHLPPAALAARIGRDPVVTSNGDRLRFESFSSCCGGYARYDVLRGGLDGEVLACGSTNVDVNAALRDALAHVSGAEPLRVQVGTDELTVTAGGDSVVEKRVDLPRRWLKGFAEVQVAAAGMDLRAWLPPVEARRLLQSLPAKGAVRRPVWAVPTSRTLRLVTSPVPGAVCLAGPERLQALRPLLRFACALSVYGPPAGAGSPPLPSAWELTLDAGRFVLVLSPEVSRGLSGEGGVLAAVLADETAADADLVAGLLAFQPRIEIGALADDAGLSVGRVRAALQYLGSAGRAGFDLAEAAYFHRELPYDPDAVRALHPRAVAARALVDGGGVRPDPVDAALVRVRSGPDEYLVRLPASGVAGAACTCRWWSRHRGERGPCKHVLAADLRRRDATGAAR